MRKNILLSEFVGPSQIPLKFHYVISIPFIFCYPITFNPILSVIVNVLEYIGIEKCDRKRAVEKKTFLQRDANDGKLNRSEIKGKSKHGLSLMSLSSTKISRVSTPADPSSYRIPCMSSFLTPNAAIATPEMASSSKEQSASTSRIFEDYVRIIQECSGSGKK